jgi:hypothetical protein
MKIISKITFVSLLTLLIISFPAQSFSQQETSQDVKKTQTQAEMDGMNHMMQKCEMMVGHMRQMMGKKMCSGCMGMMNMKGMMMGMQGMAEQMKHMMNNINQMMANNEMMKDKKVNAHAKKIDKNLKMMKKQMMDTIINMEEMQKRMDNLNKEESDK